MSRVELDCRGVSCPRPVIELAKTMAEVAVGDSVAVTTEDPAAGVDIQAWCRMQSQDYVGEETAPDGVPTYVVRRIS